MDGQTADCYIDSVVHTMWGASTICAILCVVYLFTLCFKLAGFLALIGNDRVNLLSTCHFRYGLTICVFDFLLH